MKIIFMTPGDKHSTRAKDLYALSNLADLYNDKIRSYGCNDVIILAFPPNMDLMESSTFNSDENQVYFMNVNSVRNIIMDQYGEQEEE